MFGIEAVFTVLVAGGIAFAVLRSSLLRRNKARRAAEALGLSLWMHDGLQGLYRGVRVWHHAHNEGETPSNEGLTQGSLLERLPDDVVVTFPNPWVDWLGRRDVVVGSELDMWLRKVGRRPEELRDLLTDPDVEQALLAVHELQARVHIENAQLELYTPGDHLDDPQRAIAHAVQLVVALAEARRRHWRAVAGAYGLTLSASLDALHGTVGGIDVAAEYGSRPGTTTPTVIQATLRRPLPEGTHIVRAGLGPSRVTLGDPVLDAMLAMQTSDGTALAERLCTDEVRGPLLEVVHGHPRSEVTPTRVWLVMDWPGAAFPTAFAAVVDLARALD